jgi:hypothetical protein
MIFDALLWLFTEAWPHDCSLGDYSERGNPRRKRDFLNFKSFEISVLEIMKLKHVHVLCCYLDRVKLQFIIYKILVQQFYTE